MIDVYNDLKITPPWQWYLLFDTIKMLLLNSYHIKQQAVNVNIKDEIRIINRN